MIAIGLDATGRPVDLGFFGAPGTARLVEYQTSSGTNWAIGRFGDGTFGTSTSMRTYTANQGVHFAFGPPLTNRPTSGGVLYTVVAATTPTLSGTDPAAVTDSQLTMNLGVAFGTAPKFGYDGTLAFTASGVRSSLAFTTTGGSATPGVTVYDASGNRFGLYGSAPVTSATGGYCTTAPACSFNANFMGSGDGIAYFMGGYGLVQSGTNILSGAVVLGKSGTISVPTPPTVITFENVPGTRTANQFLIRVDPRLAISSVGPVTTVVDANGLAAYRRNASSNESPQRGTATGGESGTSDGVISWTRWAGGTTAGEFNGSGPVDLTANQGWHLVYGTAATALPSAGTATYSLAGATKPTISDGSMAPGTFTGSAAVAFGSAPRLGLDFNVNIGGSDYKTVTTGGLTTPSSSQITIASDGSFESFLTIPVTGTGSVCPSACTMSLMGMLAGTGASHLGFNYLFRMSGSTGIANVVTGSAAFKMNGGTGLVANADAPTGANMSYTVQGSYTNQATFTTSVVATTDGRLTQAGTSFQRGSATDVEHSGAAGVIGWSRWGNGTVTAANSPMILSGNQGVHSVWGKQLTNMPTTGSANYAMVGSTKPTMGDGSGAPGTFTGSLAVSFAQMKVGWESTIGFNGTNYVFNSSGGLAAPSVTLGTDGRWIGSSAPVGGIGGRAYGFLAGDGASHAGMSYFLPTTSNGAAATVISGVAAFAKQ